MQSLTGRQDDTHLGLGTRILQFNREKITKPTKTVKIIQKFTVRPGVAPSPLPNRPMPLLTTLLSARLQRSSAIVLFSAECVCLKTLLLSRRSRQRERLSASELSLWLSVCRQNAKKRFSQKLSSLELWSLLTTYRKSYLGFSKNLLLDP